VPFKVRHTTATLAKYRNQRPVVLALPSGSVLVAAEVAAVPKRATRPDQPERAMGAMVDGGTPIVADLRNKVGLLRVGDTVVLTV
jgi:predicted phosphoribosyltransferase